MVAQADTKQRKKVSKRSKLDAFRAQLMIERTSFESHWRDLGDYVLPRRIRFHTSEGNEGRKQNRRIIDSHATFAIGTLRSGMMSGNTSPARPWFMVTHPDQQVAEFGPVKQWLQTVTERMRDVMLKSNFYKILPTVYGDLGLFGTAAVFVQKDPETSLRFFPMPVGSYYLSNNANLQVDGFMREFRMTVRQIVEEFGFDRTRPEIVEPDLSKFSTTVQNEWAANRDETWIDVVHVVKPNPDFNPNRVESKFKRYMSVYYELGQTGGANSPSGSPDLDRNKFLRESGFDRFPVLAPRWETTGEDVYGTNCPGMTALGDVRSLQLLHKRKAQAIEKKVFPAMVAATQLRNAAPSTLPGDTTFVDEKQGQAYRAAHEVNFQITELTEDIRDHQNRISRAFFTDLFLSVVNSDRRQVTAREIDELHEEKFLALGPVLENFNQEFLDAAIDMFFDAMLEDGLIPDPPEEIQGDDLRVEYISIMASAQKLIGVNSIERFVAFMGQLKAITEDPKVMDKLDADQAADEFAEAVSVNPRLVVDDETVDQKRKDDAAREAALAQQQAFVESAAAAKNLSQASLEGDNALTRLAEEAQAADIVAEEGGVL